jgi:uncharacterized protein (DUF58 family)
VPTLRLLGALLLAAVIAALGGPAVLVAIALVLVTIGMAALDAYLAAQLQPFVRVRREAANKLSLGAWNPVCLHVETPAGRPLALTLRDVPASDWRLDVAAPVFNLNLSGRASPGYHVLPTQRGDAEFGDLFVRAEGPLGLVRHQWRASGTRQAVRVYPNLRELRKYDLLVRRGLQVQPGARALRVAGASTEFERVREYVPDDEFRRVNWKATARRGQPMVNQFEAERSQNLVILMDAGRLMAARADAPTTDEADAVLASQASAGVTLTKLDHALNAALLLAYVAALRGDRVALLAYTDEVRTFVPPTRGRRAFLTMVQALYNLRSEPVEPDHGRAFNFLAARGLRRSLVVLFTDLADRESASGLVAHVLRAARQHLVVTVTLGDPNIRRPAQRRPDTSASLYEKMVAQQLLDERAETLASLTHRGVLAVDTDADHLSPRLISTYLELKERARI